MKEPLAADFVIDTAPIAKAISEMKHWFIKAKNTTRMPIPAGSTIEIRFVRGKWRIVGVEPSQ